MEWRSASLSARKPINMRLANGMPQRSPFHAASRHASGRCLADHLQLVTAQPMDSTVSKD